MIYHDDEQGSEGWLESRRGVITASRFRVAREKLKGGALSKAALLYAMDVARERAGGQAAEVYANAAMRFGTEQEPLARQAYEARTGNIVEEAGFITTDDAKFGVSVDGTVDDEGLVEIKTLVSSETLFSTIVDGDITAYVDQINGALWLLGRKWCDLCLWAPDLPSNRLTVIRITRDENAIEALEADLMAFERLVSQYEAKLRAKMAPKSPPEFAASAKPAYPMDAPWVMPTSPAALPANLFGASA